MTPSISEGFATAPTNDVTGRDASYNERIPKDFYLDSP
jgi:hypothetical protein